MVPKTEGGGVLATGGYATGKDRTGSRYAMIYNIQKSVEYATMRKMVI